MIGSGHESSTADRWAIEPGSAPALLREAIDAFDEVRRERVRAWAEHVRALPVDERRPFLGTFAGGRSRSSATSGDGREARLRAALSECVEARFDAHRADILKMLNVSASPRRTLPLDAGSSTSVLAGGRTKIHVSVADVLPGARIVDVGHFIGTDVHHSIGVDATPLITSPGSSLDFVWETTRTGAEGVRWTVREHPSFKVVAQGYDTGVPGGSDGATATGRFQLGFGFAPATPPDTPIQYSVSVTAYKTVSSPLYSDSATNPSGVKTWKEQLGGPSQPPFTLNYGKSTAPGTTFDFVHVYRWMSFYLDSLEMIVDQTEWGDEDFHVKGFIQAEPEDTSHVLGGFVSIDPGGDRTKPLGGGPMYWLQNPGEPHWPKVFTVVLSALEEDDGDFVATWSAKIAEFGSGQVKEIIHALAKTKILEYVEDVVPDLADALLNVNVLGDVLSGLVDFIVAPIVGAVIDFFFSWIVDAIVEGLEDDYLGTKTHVLVLPSNDVEFVATLPGKWLGPERFQSAQAYMDFRSESSWWQPTKWDGWVRVRFHYELFHKEML